MKSDVRGKPGRVLAEVVQGSPEADWSRQTARARSPAHRRDAGEAQRGGSGGGAAIAKPVATMLDRSAWRRSLASSRFTRQRSYSFVPGALPRDWQKASSCWATFSGLVSASQPPSVDVRNAEAKKRTEIRISISDVQRDEKTIAPAKGTYRNVGHCTSDLCNEDKRPSMRDRPPQKMRLRKLRLMPMSGDV